MIFAQRPDATACAEYDLWNDTMRRYVRRGSKGIALIDTSGDRPRLRYVFDVSDTGERRNSRPVQLWQMKEEYREPIMKALEQAFDVSREGQSLESMIYAAAERLASDYWDNYRRQILDIVEESYLAGYHEFETGVTFRRAAAASIAAGARMTRTAILNMRISWTSLISTPGRRQIRWERRSAAFPDRSSGKSKPPQGIMNARKQPSRPWRKNDAGKPCRVLPKQLQEGAKAMMKEVTYTQKGDYLIPDIQMETTEVRPLGKYGRMRRAYLQENNPMLMNDLILTEKLYPHLWEIQRTASARMEQLMLQLLQRNPAPEKKSDPMGWTQHMNSLKAQAEEIVTAELITS